MKNSFKNDLPLVSIITPCRNEEKFIGKCLDSIMANDYPRERLEILVIDGMSEDKTREIVNNYSEKIPQIKIIDNYKKTTPQARNLGIKNAKGEIIIIMDAHATYENRYISKCIKHLHEYQADSVGGIMKTRSREKNLIGEIIAVALSSSFGVGRSRFRTGIDKPTWVDTVFGGCYKKEVFDKIGLFNENLTKGQDWEFNTRLKQAGGKILLSPAVVSYYYARSKINLSFLKFYFNEGFWSVYPSKFVGRRFISLWRLVPMFFVLTLVMTLILSFFISFFWRLFLFVLGIYFLSGFYFSVKTAIIKKCGWYALLMPLIFFIIHFPYGFGSIYAGIRILIEKPYVIRHN